MNSGAGSAPACEWVGEIEVVWGPAPDPFDSTLVVLRDGASLVMVRNRVRGWEFPGGRREAGESIEENARREALEEACVCLGPVTVAGYYRLPDGHVTAITHAEVVESRGFSDQFETSEMRRFETLPDDVSFKDGLYQHLLSMLPRCD